MGWKYHYYFVPLVAFLGLLGFHLTVFEAGNGSLNVGKSIHFFTCR